ncbi:Protein NEN3 [Hibiscus syriacus]|uniref:Protein NEN3 n=1 Tax=Hibiscus syriacus TaxID=106335 RepID=A0A6A3AQH8_HIBSY|nr:Protein NEN3 [Hibiscus syriacus]
MEGFIAGHEGSAEIVFFDIETTVPNRAGQRFWVLEFGAIVVCPRNFVELESYSTLIKPKDLSAVALRSGRCDGITRDAVANAPAFEQVADKIFSLLNGRIWAGHNIQRFDCVRIKEAFADIGRPPPVSVGIIDSLGVLTDKFGKRAGNMKMASLATYFGLGQQKHRSLEDVRMNLEVLKHCATVLFLLSMSNVLDVEPANCSMQRLLVSVMRTVVSLLSLSVMHSIMLSLYLIMVSFANPGGRFFFHCYFFVMCYGNYFSELVIGLDIPKNESVKLTKSTYLLWKHQVALIIDGYGLISLLSNDVVLPDEFVTCHQVSLSTEVLPYLTGLTTTSSIWSAVYRLFGARSGAKILSFRHSLHSQRNSGLTISEYLAKVKSISDLLNASGNVVTEQEHVSVILVGLSMEFESIIVIASHENLSLKVLTDMLLDYEARQKAFLSEGVTTNLARLSREVNNVEVDAKENNSSQLRSHSFASSGPVVFNSDVSSGSARLSVPLETVWYPDMGATHHVSNDMSVFESVIVYTGANTFLMGNDEGVKIDHTRTLLLRGKLAGEGLYQLLPYDIQESCDKHEAVFQVHNVSGLLNALELWHKRLGTSEQNGKAERKHRHVVEMGLAMLSHASLPLKFWSHAFISIVYLISRLPTGVLGGRSSCVFHGYSSSHKGYKCLDDSVPTVGSWVSSWRDSGVVERNKDVFVPLVNPYGSPHGATGIACNSEEAFVSPNNVEVVPCTEPVEQSTAVHESVLSFMGLVVSSSRNLEGSVPTHDFTCDFQFTSQNAHPMVTRGKIGIRKPKALHVACLDKEPRSIKEAMLIPLPKDRQVVRCKWIFKIKRNPYGTVSCYKARLVAKGFVQQPEVDFHEVFSPVVKPTTVHRYGFDDAKGLPTPMVSTCKLSARDGDSITNFAKYQSIVGALQYVVVTRPGISYSVNRVCQFMQSPLDMHFHAVKWILYYLQGTNDYELRFTPSSRLSLTGSAMVIFVNHVLHYKFKHVEFDLFFVREMVVAGKLQVHKVPAYEQVVNVLTKPFSVTYVLKHPQKLLITQLRT